MASKPPSGRAGWNRVHAVRDDLERLSVLFGGADRAGQPVGGRGRDDGIRADRDTRRAHGHARELLRYAVIRAGLLVESGPGHFAFCHRAVQEHLAACAIDARGRDGVVRHLAEHRLHEPEWRNVHLLLVSMQRGTRARAVIEYVLDAGSTHEKWLHRDLLLVGEALGESPALVAGIDDELAVRVASEVLGIGTRSWPEVGHLVSQAAVRVLRSWQDTPMRATSRQCLARMTDRSSPVERHCVEAIVGDVRAAQDALVELIVSAESKTAARAAMAVRDLGVELQLTVDHVAAILGTIPARVRDLESGVETAPTVHGRRGRWSPRTG